jgi:hypothetical protein
MLKDNSNSTQTEVKIMDNLWTFTVAFFCVGPFALPLLWRNPRFTHRTKAGVTAAALVVTVLLIWITGKSFTQMMENLRALQELQAS